MKRTTGTIVAIVAMGCMTYASAKGRDDHIKLPIQGALEKGQSYKETVGTDIKLLLGHAEDACGRARKMGEFTSNKKTNAANKSDQEACDLAFISAVIGLQQRARKEGGNAVVNIHSVYAARTPTARPSSSAAPARSWPALPSAARSSSSVLPRRRRK